jgi:hypothetical protein
MSGSLELYSKSLEDKLHQLDEAAKSVPTEAILRALNCCHDKLTESGRVGSKPFALPALEKLQEDCDELEGHFFSLLGQLQLFDAKDVIDVYKELIDVVVSHEYAVGPRTMSTEFETPPVEDCSDIKQYFKSDYLKHAKQSRLSSSSSGILPLKDVVRFGNINDVLRKTESMLSQACHLRELQVEELFENCRILKPATINHNKGRKKKMDFPDGTVEGSRNDSTTTFPISQAVSVKSAVTKIKVVKSNPLKPMMKGVKTEKKVVTKVTPKALSGDATDPPSSKRTLKLISQVVDDKSPFHSYIQPTDLLRCLVAELATRGLPVKTAAEHKLGQIQRDPQACAASSLYEKPVVIELLGSDVKVAEMSGGSAISAASIDKAALKKTTILAPIPDAVDYQSIGLCMDKQLQKPVGRAALDLVTENIQSSLESLQSFDASWQEGRNEVCERHVQQWVDRTALRAKLSGAPPITSLQQVPLSAELIANPFGSCRVGQGARGVEQRGGEELPEQEWGWLTSLPGYANSMEKIHRQIESGEVMVKEEDRAQSASSALEDIVAHPFINPNSLLYGQASVQDCLSPRLLHTLVGAGSQQHLRLSSNMQQREAEVPFLLDRSASPPSSSGLPSHPHCLQDAPLFQALQPVNRASPANTDTEFLSARQRVYGAHIDRLQMGHHFTQSVDRALTLLNLGYNVLVVDGSTRPVTDSAAEEKCHLPTFTSKEGGAGEPPGVPTTTAVPDTFHRARLLAGIMKGHLRAHTDKSEDHSEKGSQLYRNGPVVIVCRANELLDFQDILQRECDATTEEEEGGSEGVLRLLPY